MSDKVFFDTDKFLYAHDPSETEKRRMRTSLYRRYEPRSGYRRRSHHQSIFPKTFQGASHEPRSSNKKFRRAGQQADGGAVERRGLYVHRALLHPNGLRAAPQAGVTVRSLSPASTELSEAIALYEEQRFGLGY